MSALDITLLINVSSIIESGRPEATKEVSGVVERMIISVALAKCPITMSGLCEYPDSCVGCHEVIVIPLAKLPVDVKEREKALEVWVW